MKQRTIKTGILVDPMGHGMGEVTPEMEVLEHIKEFTKLVRPAKLKPYTLQSAHKISAGTELVLFDYGGMMEFGSGDLVTSEARALLRWANDHPSALVVVMSAYTYRNVIHYELEDMGLKLHNVIAQEIGRDPIPMWFRDPDMPVKIRDKRISEHPLAGLTPVGGTLPDSQFFKPSPKFISFMKEHFSKEDIVEAGAGMGHTAKALKDAGLTVKAVDANRRKGSVYKVEIADATEYDYHSPLVLICRPCHGSFCEAVVQRAVQCQAPAVVYVGLSKNASGDLGKFRRNFKLEMRGAGEDKEGVYVWRLPWNQYVDDEE